MYVVYCTSKPQDTSIKAAADWLVADAVDDIYNLEDGE